MLTSDLRAEREWHGSWHVGYEVLLQMLRRYFAHTEETDAQLATLWSASIALMVGVLKPLGDLITTLPVGPEQPGMTAGASFEVFHENDYLMPHRQAAWALLEERVRWLAAMTAASFADTSAKTSRKPSGLMYTSTFPGSAPGNGRVKMLARSWDSSG